MTALRVIAPCNLVEVHRRFTDAYNLHHHGDFPHDEEIK